MAAGLAHQFAAGGFGQGPWWQQQNPARGDLGFCFNPLDQGLAKIRSGFKRQADFEQQGQLFAVWARERHSDGTAGANRRKGWAQGLDLFFQILGIEIAPAHNDQVFDAACDIDFAPMQKAQIAAAQPRKLAAVIQVSAKVGLGFGLAVPIALGNMGAAQPDFTHVVFSQVLARLRIHHPHLFVAPGAARTHQYLGIWALVIRDLGGQLFDPVFGQGCAADREIHRALMAQTAADKHRGLGHAISGIHRVAGEARRSEIAQEFFNCGMLYGFCAV